MKTTVLPLLLVTGWFFAASAQADNGPLIHLNSQVVDTTSNNTVAAVSRTGPVNNLFAEQKSMVMQMLGELGITAASLPPQVKAQLEKPHTQNFNAFVAYSMGINYMDQGRYAEARAAFSRSATMDPSFQQAVQMERSTPLTRESVTRMVERTTRMASQRGGEFLSGHSPPANRPATPAPAAPAAATSTSLQQAMQQTVGEIQAISSGVASLVENIHRDPNSAPDQLRLATSRGLSPGMALETALVVLDRPPAALVERVLGEALRAGISVDDAHQVASQLRSRSGCR
ncbi:MAG: hypothetical protein HQL55_17010 [Magnetococcales bacterium]|nr:hypothetical protein [Magnetococcales bacterium]